MSVLQGLWGKNTDKEGTSRKGASTLRRFHFRSSWGWAIRFEQHIRAHKWFCADYKPGSGWDHPEWRGNISATWWVQLGGGILPKWPRNTQVILFRTPLINAQCRSIPIKILSLIRILLNTTQPINFSQCFSIKYCGIGINNTLIFWSILVGIDRHWSRRSCILWEALHWALS